jgi:NitT/TauT family transport system substrate-binding protein
MMRSHACWLILAVVAVIAPSRATFAEATPIHLRIGIGGDASSSEPVFAKQTGIFRRHGIDADIVVGIDGAQTAKAIGDGKLDLGYGNVIGTVQANQRGEHFVLLATGGMYRSAAPITVLAQSIDADFRTGKDLIGKKIATPRANDLGQIAVMSWLDKHGGDARSVEFVHGIPIQDIAAALADHRIDAGLITEPQWTIQRKRGTVKLLANSFGAIAPRYANSAFFAERSWAEANPEAARRFARAMQETARWANKHHAEAQKILAGQMKVPLSTITGAIRIVYADSLQAKLVQPPLDAAARYGLIRPVRAEDLMFR